MSGQSRGGPSDWRARLEASLHRLWFDAPTTPARLLAVGLLTPPAWLVGLVSRRRREQIEAARSADRRDFRPDPFFAARPVVIVIGNLVAGGAGKTPLTLAVAKHLQDQGLQIGLIARGTGSLGREMAQPVGPDDDAERAGDEAVLLARRSGAPVYVARQRAQALQRLVAEHPEVQVVLADDGLQHVALRRDLQIVVIDQRGLGNGRLLPAGPLREPPDMLAGVDAVVMNRGWQTAAAADPATRAIDASIAALALMTPRFESRLQVRDVLPLTAYRTNTGPAIDHGHGPAGVPGLAALGEGPIAAVAGIANPESFFGLLEALNLSIIRYPLGDHAPLDRAWLAGLPQATIVMTEKDAVKCPDDSSARVFVLRVQACPEPALFDWLATTLRRRHDLGPTTA